jgi:predicted phosphodiesterase
MRIAVLADIHGNLAALEAALDRVEDLWVDQLVVAGDVVVGSPDSLACWQRVRALGCPVLRGNHERYVCDLGTERAPPEWSTPQFGPVQYAAAQLGAEIRKELASLPMTLRLRDTPDLLIVHGSPQSDSDLVFPYTSEAALAGMFGDVFENWIVRAHNHYAGVRLWGNRRIVTTGSVGLPLDGSPTAQFSVLEWREGTWAVEHHSVAYDVETTLKRFRKSGYLEQAGPMARLFMREVETASFHIVPFLKWQTEQKRAGGTLELGEAVDAFLRR